MESLVSPAKRDQTEMGGLQKRHRFDVHHVYEDVVVHYLGSPNFSAFAPGLSLSIFMPRCYESHAQSLGVVRGTRSRALLLPRVVEVMSSSGLRTNPLVLVTDQKISMAQQVTRVVVLVSFLFFVVMIENPSGNAKLWMWRNFCNS